MYDYLNSYNDMSVFMTMLDEGNIAPAIDNLCKEIGFIFYERKERYSIYKSTNDERSFLLSVEGTTPEHFYLLYIKCKSALKYHFFYCIDKQLREMEDWGIPIKNVDEYPDLLTCKADHSNPFVRNLVEFGLIENVPTKCI